MTYFSHLFDKMKSLFQDHQKKVKVHDLLLLGYVGKLNAHESRNRLQRCFFPSKDTDPTKPDMLTVKSSWLSDPETKKKYGSTNNCSNEAMADQLQMQPR